MAVVLENGNKNGNKLALGVDHTLDQILPVNGVSKMVKVWIGGNGFLYYIPMWMMMMLYSMRLLESYEEVASD